jgi:hypothetical protein
MLECLTYLARDIFEDLDEPDSGPPKIETFRVGYPHIQNLNDFKNKAYKDWEDNLPDNFVN